MASAKKYEPGDILFRIKRGLCGYVSYLAACDMNESFSEYVLYEPILRILQARGFTVSCEVECPGIPQPLRGDKKRLDFLAFGYERELAIEVKWVTHRALRLGRDIEKLEAVLRERPKAYSLLCIFGRRSFIENFAFAKYGLVERGEPVYADFKRTRYGCRIFQFKLPRRRKLSRPGSA